MKLPHNGLEALGIAINDSLDKDTFSSCIKTTIVIPLHKERDRMNLAIFRPISRKTALSKLVGKIIKKLMRSYVTTFTPKQYGFRVQGVLTMQYVTFWTAFPAILITL